MSVDDMVSVHDMNQTVSHTLALKLGHSNATANTEVPLQLHGYHVLSLSAMTNYACSCEYQRKTGREKINLLQLACTRIYTQKVNALVITMQDLLVNFVWAT